MRTALLILSLAAVPAVAQPLTPAQRSEVVAILHDALRSDPSILRDAVTALQADDQQLEADAARQSIAAARGQLMDPAAPAAGNVAGDVTVVEFFDTRCPYCAKLNPTIDALLAKDPKVRLIYKDMPILGAASVAGSRALLAAQRQEATVPNAYQRLRAVLMSPGAAATPDAIVAAAGRLGLNVDRLRHDMDDPAILSRLQANVTLAQSLGITGTPGLVVGSRVIAGAADLPELTSAVAAARLAAR